MYKNIAAWMSNSQFITNNPNKTMKAWCWVCFLETYIKDKYCGIAVIIWILRQLGNQSG